MSDNDKKTAPSTAPKAAPNAPAPTAPSTPNAKTASGAPHVEPSAGNTPQNLEGFQEGHTGNPTPAVPAGQRDPSLPTTPGGVPHALQDGQPAPIVPATMPNPPAVQDRNHAGVIQSDTPARSAPPPATPGTMPAGQQVLNDHGQTAPLPNGDTNQSAAEPPRTGKI